LVRSKKKGTFTGKKAVQGGAGMLAVQNEGKRKTKRRGGVPCKNLHGDEATVTCWGEKRVTIKGQVGGGPGPEKEEESDQNSHPALRPTGQKGRTKKKTGPVGRREEATFDR